jgi:hypothetical protein
MMPIKYLQGLDATDPDIPGVYGVPHARVRGSWRIVCSYADGKRHKRRLFTNMDAAGQPEQRGTWEWHHVVEGQHYADIDFTGKLPELYVDALPCVLLAREEHAAYNRVLHIRETDELYRDMGLPADLRQRSAAAVDAARDRMNHPRLRLQVANLQWLYRNTYAGDHVLIAIADNVFNDVLSNLR